MTVFLTEWATDTWRLVLEMAPYLLFGFGAAGLLHCVLRKEKIRSTLGRSGAGSVVKAAIIGIPMPLCSCSVLPVAAFLRKHGASKGAIASFLSSTPQTGIDSIFATYSLMGSVFTGARVAVAFACGFLTGWLVDRSDKQKTPTPILTIPTQLESPTGKESTPKRTLKDAWKYGFLTLPADLAASLAIGLLLAGLVTSLFPEHSPEMAFGTGWSAFAMATIIGLPLYVCATASIPMAYALMTCGFSPGAALVFLIVGPATNTATVVAVWSLIGRRSTFIYIASLIALAWLAGWLLDGAFEAESIREGIRDQTCGRPALWQHFSGVALIALLAFAYCKVKTTERKKSCCGSRN